MSWFHPEEAGEVGVLLRYERRNPGTRYLVDFPDGESYACVYATDYESESTGELDIEMDDPRPDRQSPEHVRVEFEIGVDLALNVSPLRGELVVRGHPRKSTTPAS